jgi:RimJ/RimL family protein N-acetyltransferase
LELFHGQGEAAYWVIPAARGRGIAFAALSAMTQWLFDEVGLHRIALVHSTRNEPSCRVATKAGFALEGTLRGDLLHADGWHDVHLHARLQHD